MKKTIWFFIATALIIALMIGCARQPAPTPTPTPAVTPTPDEQLGEQDPDNVEEQPDVEEATTPEGVADGQYEGRSDTDERANYGIVRLTVENETITEVVYEEYTADDEIKAPENDYTYEEALESFEALPQQLVETQDVMAVDDYTGATGTSNKFRVAAKRALGQGLQDEWSG